MDTDCAETWDGSKWISICAEGEITGFTCGSVTGTRSTTIASLANINLNNLTIPYTKTVGALTLANNTVLGETVSGLRVRVRQNQTLSTGTSGTLNIKIDGTPTVFGTIQVPVSYAGTSCTIAVTVSQSAGAIGTLTFILPLAADSVCAPST